MHYKKSGSGGSVIIRETIYNCTKTVLLSSIYSRFVQV